MGFILKRFAALFQALDQTTKTNEKVAALADYFGTASDDDKLWTIALFSGRRPKRAITVTRLREWAAERAGIPLWLFEESYPIVGDLAETIALILPDPSRDTDMPLAAQIDEIRGLDTADEVTRKSTILAAWDRYGTAERFVFNKLITGGFRMGVSQKLMTRALSRATGIEEAELAHRLMGDWSPDNVSYQSLILAPDPDGDIGIDSAQDLAQGRGLSHLESEGPLGEGILETPHPSQHVLRRHMRLQTNLKEGRVYARAFLALGIGPDVSPDS